MFFKILKYLLIVLFITQNFNIFAKETKICQSCGIPLMPTATHFLALPQVFKDYGIPLNLRYKIGSAYNNGTEVDGSFSEEYCIFCYKDGKFVQNITMDEYIEICLPYTISKGMSEKEARETLKKDFSKLKRWKKN